MMLFMSKKIIHLLNIKQIKMAEIINMPRLSDTMEEGTLAKWFKKVGDSVKEGEILAEIETDKATMEFESFHDGVLLHIGIDEGSTAPVDSIIAIIGSKGEDSENSSHFEIIFFTFLSIFSISDFVPYFFDKIIFST